MRNNLERTLEDREIIEEAKKLANSMPLGQGEKTVYVRNLAAKVKQGKLDLEIFKVFVKITNTWMELKTCEILKEKK